MVIRNFFISSIGIGIIYFFLSKMGLFPPIEINSQTIGLILSGLFVIWFINLTISLGSWNKKSKETLTQLFVAHGHQIIKRFPADVIQKIKNSPLSKNLLKGHITFLCKINSSRSYFFQQRNSILGDHTDKSDYTYGLLLTELKEGPHWILMRVRGESSFMHDKPEVIKKLLNISGEQLDTKGIGGVAKKYIVLGDITKRVFDIRFFEDLEKCLTGKHLYCHVDGQGSAQILIHQRYMLSSDETLLTLKELESFSRFLLV